MIEIVLCHFYVNPRANLKNNDIPETYKIKYSCLNTSIDNVTSYDIA